MEEGRSPGHEPGLRLPSFWFHRLIAVRLCQINREADEVLRGVDDQALMLLNLLKGTSLSERAEEKAERIRSHSGIETDGESEGQARGRSGSGKFEGTKVLVVDDEREIVLLLDQILTGEGFKVFTAMDGQECRIEPDDALIAMAFSAPNIKGVLGAPVPAEGQA